MNTETKYVKITSANSSQAWYTKMIGNVYPLGVSNDYYNHRIELGTCAACYISKSDCEEITIAPQTRQADYTITEEQIEELYGMGKEGYSESISDKLEEWFPEVFKPTPTYKVGDRFSNKECPEISYELIAIPGNMVCVLVGGDEFYYNSLDSDGNTEPVPVKVSDLQAITEEELSKIIGKRRNLFSLKGE